MSRQTADLIDEQVLFEEAKTLSMYALAKKYQVNYTTIFKKLHKNSDFKPKKGRPPKIELR